MTKAAESSRLGLGNGGIFVRGFFSGDGGHAPLFAVSRALPHMGMKLVSTGVHNGCDRGASAVCVAVTGRARARARASWGDLGGYCISRA